MQCLILDFPREKKDRYRKAQSMSNRETERLDFGVVLQWEGIYLMSFFL